MTILLLAALLGTWMPAAEGVGAPPGDGRHGFTALVFSKTAGFRHDSIDEGIAAIESLGAAHDFSVVATEDASVFSDAGLEPFDVVIFLSTTGDVLDSAQQAALERFVQGGGGWLGIHAAADTEYTWSWYGGLVGAWFNAHPATQPATVRVLDSDHPSTASLPQTWDRTDEWYDYLTNPRGQVHVLATLDDDSYSGGTMGFDHPIAWCRPYDGGRSWYTGMGHTPESYSETEFQAHLLGGIEWAAGVVEGDCTATIGSLYDVEVLEPDVESPMDLEVASDGAVFFVELGGRVRRYDPTTRFTSTIAEIDVFQNFEDGLIGIVLDPGFDTNGWVYLFYSPADGAPRQHISRFTWNGTVLDPLSEVVLLDFPTQRDECCHSGGSMVFDGQGNLLIAVGDNTNPFASDGYAPVDERSGRAPWDAQGTSSNTSDFRGKILRISPNPDGSYDIPEGNLFPGGQGGLAEIYAMGVRNPFRISIDPATGWLYWGDVGPDARNATPGRGPAGLDEWNQAREAGNFGWPYCIGPNLAYSDWDFATGSSKGVYNCEAPVNDSPNNTGATSLPPAIPAWIWYPYGPSTEFPGITDGPGRTAMAGPVYQYDASRPDEIGLPAYFQDRLLIYEWSRSYIRVVTLDSEGNPLSIDPFPGDPELSQPIAMKTGPDGALYLLEWGNGFGTGNPDAQLSRIASSAGGGRPTAVLSADVLSGSLPLTVTFSADDSRDPDGDLLSYSWDADGNGTEDGTDERLTFTYTVAGSYTARLRVSDTFGNESLASVNVFAGNTAPTVEVLSNLDGGFFAWGDRVAFEVSVDDPEDGSTASGSIDCSRVQAQLFLGHDSHTHPLESVTGCEGEIPLSDGHGGEGDKIFHVVEFSYTDLGAEGVPGITTTREVILLPERLELEHYDSQEGVQVEATTDIAGSASNIGFLDHGDWVRFDNVGLTGVDHLTFRVASAGRGGRIEVRRDLTEGAPLATAVVSPTGGWQSWRDVTVPVDDSEPASPLYLLFVDEPGGSGLFNINYLRAHGPGISRRQPDVTGFSTSYSANGVLLQRAIEPQISYDWGSDRLGDYDAAVWEGTLLVPTSGNYTFTLRAQGTAVLSLDEIETLAIVSPNSVREEVSDLRRLRASTPTYVKVEYEPGSKASLWLEISGPGLSLQTLGGAIMTPVGVIPVEEGIELPTVLNLSNVYPNPTRSDAKMELALPSQRPVSWELFDLLGRRVGGSGEKAFRAGIHSIDLELGTLSPGLYFAVIRAGSERLTRSVVRLR